MKKTLLGMCFILASFNSDAAFLATKSGSIEASKASHVIVIGLPEKLGSLFVDSALTKASLLNEVAPEEQVIIVGRNEDRDLVVSRGYKVLESDRSMLSVGTVRKAISKTKVVASLDVFAHSNAMSGIIIDKNAFTSQLLEEKDEIWGAIKAKSRKDTFIMFQGCNAGVKLGPWVAGQTKLPVLAALTGTDFQYIYNDAFWAHDYNGKKEELSETNALISQSALSCKKGYCTRMKPDNAAYRGHWGDWSEGGYPTYKIFCGSNDTSKCAAGAIEAIKTFPSIVSPKEITSLGIFKEVVADFLCPFGHNTQKQNECKEALESSLTEKSTYSPFRGTTLNCDFTRCHAHFKCNGLKASFAPGSCKLKNEKPGANSTFTNEYKFLVEAYESSHGKGE